MACERTAPNCGTQELSRPWPWPSCQPQETGDTGRHATPAGVDGRDRSRVGARDQDRHAVGDTHPDGDRGGRTPRNKRVRLVAARLLRQHGPRTVDLLHLNDLANANAKRRAELRVGHVTRGEGVQKTGTFEQWRA